VLKNVEAGNELTTARLPPGNWILLAKHIDTSGNYSEVASKTLVSVENNKDIIFEEEHGPRWPGEVSGFVRHFVSGTLIPRSTKPANEHTNEELFEQFIPYPVEEYSYITIDHDFGFDATQLRVWGDINSELGRGASGSPSPQMYIDYRSNAGGYDGYELWNIGRINAAAIKFKTVGLSANGVSIMRQFKTVIDADERKEKYPGLTIAPGGETISYANRFISVPLLRVTPADAALIPYYTNKTTTSVTVHLKNASGADVGGVADVTLEGA
jgi:hypothetical protein